MSVGASLKDLYLTGSGRIRRRAFLAGILPLATAWLAFERFGAGAPGWVGYLLAAALLYFAACVTAQRLHDRGRAGWWVWPLLGAVVAAWVWCETPLGWALAVLLVAALVELALRPGQPHFTRYGPPPT